MKGLEPLGAELRRELGRLGPAGAIGEVVEAWPGAVGAAIAANAWPARIARDGTLHVATSSSAWAFELTHLADTVRGRLKERLGTAAPSALRFAPGRLPEPGAESVESSARTVPTPSPAARAAGEQIAAEIEDQGLREAVARAAAASLAAAERRPADRPI
ncbi:MAG: DciA family protein [Gaiellaceae bacterium]